jgi:hypothetical protein
MQRFVRALWVGLSLMLLAAGVAHHASAEVYSCQIGKPSYCFKYGEGRCPILNTVPNKAAACTNWTRACIDCHTAIPTCLGNKRPLSTAPSCTRCSQKWLACMRTIDQRYWPDRQKPTP